MRKLFLNFIEQINLNAFVMFELKILSLLIFVCLLQKSKSQFLIYHHARV